MSETEREDRSHRPLCDWNLYPENRDDPELCNLSCAAHPDDVAKRWRALEP